MTFYEAALRVLEGVGRPLHVLEITKQSISQNLLSHIGKTPDETMLSRLAAIARRTRDRRIVVTAKDTFALAEWAFPEDPEALSQTGLVEPNPEEDLPPLRTTERHPEPRGDNVRGVGRLERKRKDRDREDDEGKLHRKRRFPPMTEMAFEILSEEAKPMTAAEIVERAQTKGMAGELGADRLLQAILEDNQRRAEVGRPVLFIYALESGLLSIDKDAPPPNALPESEATSDGVMALKVALKDVRQAFVKRVLQRLAGLEPGTFEKTTVKMLLALNFREIKVAKRFSSSILYTSRRREGSTDVRYAIRILSAHSPIDRKCVQEFRRDMAQRGSQMGLLLGTGELRGDGRGEASTAGSMVWLWCAEALAEKLIESKVGLKVSYVEMFELDDPFFDRMALEAAEAQKRREERLRERSLNPASTSSESESGGGSEEGVTEPLGSAPSAGAGDPDRKRRRRRRRGRKPSGPSIPGVGAIPEGAAQSNDAAADSSPPPQPLMPPPPPPETSDSGPPEA